MRKTGMVLLLMVCSAGQAASFDCTKAKTPQEKAICASPELSKAEEEMAAAYWAVLKSAPAEMVEAVREGQRQWLRSVAITCPARSWAKPGQLEDCLKDDYLGRTDVLQGSIAWKNGIQFVWRSVTLTAPDDDDAAKEDRERGELSDHGTLNASWPQANSKSPEWQAWNVAMENAARKMATNRPQPGGEWRQEWAVDQDIDITVAIRFVSKDLVTATLTNMFFGHGAAHPNTDSIQFNWLLKEQRELQREEVFRKGSNWDQMLQKRCDQYLHKALDTDGESYESFYPGQMTKILHEIVIDPKNWQIDSSGITIVFQPYAVACYACTPSPVTISWKDLKPFLQPSFEIPKE